MKKSIVVSGGFRNFHLSMAAEELNRKGILSAFICSAYPTSNISLVLDFLKLSNHKKLNRFVSRKITIDESLLRSLYFSELLNYGSFLLNWNINLKNRFKKLTVNLYSKYCCSIIQSPICNAAKIYHYRAQFGGKSVQVAKNNGLITLCDHSIADPRVIDYLVNNDGQLPKNINDHSINILDEMMLLDIEQADAILVNSHFVKDTMVYQGYDANKIHVIYLGVDDSFVRLIPPERSITFSKNKPLRILFAGFFSYRKGADTIIQSLLVLKDIDWTIEIAGIIEKSLLDKYSEFFTKKNVKVLGMLSRNDLATCMRNNEVFLFPSRAEGSARVIFEALASGCYVITTHNAGSIVEDKIHGEIVSIGSPHSISHALTKAFTQREKVWEIGERNRKLVISNYTQNFYGDSLEVLYKKLIQQKTG